MTPFATAGLLVGLFCLPLAFIVFIYARQKVHRIWAIFNVIVAMWGLAIFLAGMSTTPESALLCWRFTYLACTFISVVFYHVIAEFCQIKRPRMLSFAYIQGSLFVPLIIFSDYFVGSTFYLFDSIHYHKATFLFTLWLLIWFIITGSAFCELHRFIKKSQGAQRTQALYLFWVMFLGHTGGAITVIPSFNIPFYPAWHFMVCIYAVISTYAIFRYQMMDIKIVIKKGFIYSILVVILTIVYLLLVFVAEKLFQGLLGYQSVMINIFSIVILGMLFNPIKNKVQGLLDQYFFHGTLESLAQEKQRLQHELYQKEKLAYIGQLASSIVHEIRNPLTTISTFVESVHMKYNDPEFMQKFQTLVPKEIQRIRKVVTQLLNLAKPREKNFVIIPICSFIDHTLAFLENNLAVKKINIERHYQDCDIKIFGDEDQLKQVFLNLLLNGIQAMGLGGKFLICVNKKKNEGVVIITVQDTGPGISDENLNKLFTPFFTTKKNGIGLGLVITKEIMDDHNGRVWVQSNEGSGAKFCLEFPVRC